MIILSKRRILTLIGLIFIGLISFFIQTNGNKKDIIPVMALPASNKVIVLDARTWKT